VTNQSGPHESPSSKDVGRRVRVVIADDFPEVLDAVERKLNSEYEIVGRAGDGLALLDSVCKLQPDILITDISMPELTGIEALRRLRSMGIRTPAVILSIHEDEELAREALLQGASGFVLKSQLEDDLQIAIREALAGRTFISERLRRRMPDY
jgi:DNA-binding NarL/FixJ family response regulator